VAPRVRRPYPPAMATWTRTLLVPLCMGMLACPSDDGGESGTDDGSSSSSDTSATATTPTTDNPTTTDDPTTSTASSTTDPSSSTTSDDTTGSSTSEETETTASTGTTGTGTTGDETTGTTGDETTGSMASPYEGAWDATFEGLCGKLAVSGTLDFDVDADGVITGTMMGNDNGPLDGTVSDMGAFDITAMGASAGMCSFIGDADDMNAITGTWSCPDLDCTGTWAGGPEPAEDP